MDMVLEQKMSEQAVLPVEEFCSKLPAAVLMEGAVVLRSHTCIPNGMQAPVFVARNPSSDAEQRGVKEPPVR
eukprot:5194705-Amphidinium_carterae.1